MNVMICFEVSAKQDGIRKELSNSGYMASWKVKRGKDELTYHLPSNCMWRKGETMSSAKAKEDLKKAASTLNVKVVRAIVLPVNGFDGMTGSPVGSSAKETAEA